MRGRSAWRSVVPAFALVAAGCSGSAEEPPGLDAGTQGPQPSVAEPPPTGEPTTTDGAGPATGDGPALEVATEAPADAPDSAVFEAYVTYWETDMRALGDPGADHAALLELVADPQQERVATTLTGLQERGHRTVGVFRIAPSVVTVAGPTATIQDCLDARDAYNVDGDGVEVAGSRGDRVMVEVQLAAAAGDWLVADVRRVERACP
ncbi:MAG: hypothetical protein ACRDWI_03585 [Jiangellaceae bacterium]